MEEQSVYSFDPTAAVSTYLPWRKVLRPFQIFDHPSFQRQGPEHRYFAHPQVGRQRRDLPPRSGDRGGVKGKGVAREAAGDRQGETIRKGIQ